MGIHIHREGTPYNCGCCDIRERLMNLYDRTHAAVLDVNGYTPDGEGHLFIPDIQDVTDLREDVEDLKEGEEGLIATVNQQAQSIQDLSGSVESIESELSSHDGRITTNTQNIANDRQYLEAVAEDVASLLTKETAKSLTDYVVDPNLTNLHVARTGNVVQVKLVGSSIKGNFNGSVLVTGLPRALSSTATHVGRWTGEHVGMIMIETNSTSLKVWSTYDESNTIFETLTYITDSD